MTTFRPMLAVAADLDTLTFPLLASAKLDGIRASVVDGRLLSRTLKPIPNKYVASTLSLDSFTGFDGELIVGEATAKDVYRSTVSAMMAYAGQPNFTYWVFDMHDMHGHRFVDRYEELTQRVDNFKNWPIKVLPQALITTRMALLEYESKVVDLGFEGLILRSPNAPYKYGRSTTKEGYLLKLKRFEDSEAYVLGVEEEMANGNEALTNELGRTKRSTAKDGLTGKGSMGALIVRDVHSGVEFNIGTGFTAEDRASWWKWWTQVPPEAPDVNPIVKYKFFPVGVKDKPRHPVYLGLRPAGA